MQPILPTNGALEEHVRRAALPAGRVRGQVLVSIPSYYLCHVNRAGRRHQRDTMNLLDVPPRYRQAASYPTAVRCFFLQRKCKKKLPENAQPFVTVKARVNELPLDCTAEVWPQYCPEI